MKQKDMTDHKEDFQVEESHKNLLVEAQKYPAK